MALDFGKLNFSVSFNPTAAFPLDARSYFESYNEAVAAAAQAQPAGSSESVYYHGQTLVVVENNKASFYIIQPNNTLSGIEGASGDAAITVNPELFEYDTNGNLSLKGFDTAALGAVMSVGPSGTLVWASVYTKDETDAKINEAVTKAAHLQRKVVESIDNIDPNADGADKYVYMVPNYSEESGNEYDEYMVLILEDSEGIETRIVEKVGSWNVDLSDYITTEDFVELESAVENKVTKVDGYRLMSETEGTKLAGIKDLIQSVDEVNFEVSEEGYLTLKELPISKITNLDGILNSGYKTSGGYYLINQTEKDKLGKLSFDENGNVGISGTVNVEQVQGLENWITSHANILEGLSENNLTDALLAKLNSAITELPIETVDEAYFEITDKQLALKDLPISKIANLTKELNNKANQDEFIALVADVEANTGNISILMERLTWGELI